MDVYGFFSTYDAARGLLRGRCSGLLSTSHAELSARGPFPLLGASASRFVEAALFFLPPSGGELLSTSSSSLTVEKRISVSSDVMSKAPLRQRPLLVSLAFFSGAW